jgi:hypothetical protein
MPGQGALHFIGMLFPKPGAAFYVCKKERHRSRGESCHQYPPTSKV